MTRRSWRRRLRMAAISLLAALVVAAAALEIGARLTFRNPFAAERDLSGMYENDDEPGHLRTVPGWRGEFTVEGRTVPVQLDALGLRGPEVGARRPGELRVLCLGDSFVFGYGVAAEEAFPAVLATRLTAALQRPVVAGNAGVPGSGVLEQARVLARLREPFDPDVVITAIYLGNDFIDDRVVSRFVEGGFAMGGPWATLMHGSSRARLMLWSRAWMRLEIALIDSGSPWALQPVETEAQQRAFAGFPNRKRPNQCVNGLFMDVIDENRTWEPGGPPVVPRVLATTGQALTAIREAAGRARVLVVILPTWWHLNEADRLDWMAKVGFDPKEFRRGLTEERLTALCGKLGLPVVDVSALMAETPDPTAHLYLQEDRHLNPEGHRFVAAALVEPVSALLR